MPCIYLGDGALPLSRNKEIIMSFARFMAGPVGRGVRVVAGVALIVAGLVMGSAGGYVLVAVGAVAFLAGALNFCLIAPLLKAPFTGKSLLAKGSGSQF